MMEVSVYVFIYLGFFMFVCFVLLRQAHSIALADQELNM